MRFKRKKDFKICLFIMMIFSITVGYALITTSLNINGRGSVAKATWDVHLDNLQVDPGSVTAVTPASITSDQQDVNFSVKLTQPGDYYKFNVDIVNAGTIDAVIESINKTSLTEDQSKYLNYVVRYYGTNSLVAKDYVIPAGYKQRIVVMIEYKTDVEQLSTLDNIDLGLSMRFVLKSATKNYSNVVYNFFMINNEAVFTAPKTGTYKLETWGAQGASDSSRYHGGYGGYSSGIYSLQESEKIYVFVGGKGLTINDLTQLGTVFGYPNGGAVEVKRNGSLGINFSSGGGSTHILLENKNLKDTSLKNVLIVAAGGGGACDYWRTGDNGGSGGGYIGSTTTKNHPNEGIANNNPTGGTQTSGGLGGGNLDGKSADIHNQGVYGVGGGSTTNVYYGFTSGGGGGGLYGGGASWGGSGAGGSSYIGNPSLTDKSMYCYNCQESVEESTKTISTTNVSAEPFSQYAKIGDGYARITYIG